MTCSGEPRLMPSWSRPPAMQVGRPSVLDHVQRVLVAHVDDGGADLDALRPGPDRGEQRERRRELLRAKWCTPEVGAVGAQLLDRLRQLDRLDAARRTPMRTCEYGDVDQCPNERKPIFFMEEVYG